MSTSSSIPCPCRRLFDILVLYLSRYVIRTKDDYYRLLQNVRDTGDWEAWIIHMLKGVEQTAHQIIWIISRIKEIMQNTAPHTRSRILVYRASPPQVPGATDGAGLYRKAQGRAV